MKKKCMLCAHAFHSQHCSGAPYGPRTSSYRGLPHRQRMCQAIYKIVSTSTISVFMCPIFACVCTQGDFSPFPPTFRRRLACSVNQVLYFLFFIICASEPDSIQPCVLLPPAGALQHCDYHCFLLCLCCVYHLFECSEPTRVSRRSPIFRIIVLSVAIGGPCAVPVLIVHYS